MNVASFWLEMIAELAPSVDVGGDDAVQRTKADLLSAGQSESELEAHAAEADFLQR